MSRCERRRTPSRVFHSPEISERLDSDLDCPRLARALLDGKLGREAARDHDRRRVLDDLARKLRENAAVDA
jgi:hypothetical protein